MSLQLREVSGAQVSGINQKERSKTLDCFSLKQASLDAPDKRERLQAYNNGSDCSVAGWQLCAQRALGPHGMDDGWGRSGWLLVGKRVTRQGIHVWSQLPNLG